MQIGTMTGEYFTAQAYSRQEQAEKGTDYQELIRSRMDEILEKLKKGKTEPVIQTGAQAFSEKEWDRLLEQFDSAEDALKAMMREEHAKRLKEQINKAEIMNDMDKEAEKILTSQSTMCTLPSSEPGEKAARYITWYTEEGIFCRKAGQKEGYEWSIAFESRDQYDKVMEYLRRQEKDTDWKFAADQNFWLGFLG